MTDKASPSRGQYDLLLYFALAFAITWGLDTPFVLACLRHETAPEWAQMMGGLGAWGPTLAALIVASRRGVRRDVFGRWRTNPIWIVVALFTPMAINVLATLIEVVLGGQPAHWLYPPNRPEHIAALVMFSFGEEFGWRGFAYPRMAERYGMALGSFLVGCVWSLWHLGMWCTPQGGAPALVTVVEMTLYLSFSSVVMAWLMEKGGRSIAIAIAMHAGGHLDNMARAPQEEVRLRVIRIAVVAVAAALAARALRKAPVAVVAAAV